VVNIQSNIFAGIVTNDCFVQISLPRLGSHLIYEGQRPRKGANPPDQINLGSI
jgi:hypothetical protein